MSDTPPGDGPRNPSRLENWLRALGLALSAVIVGVVLGRALGRAHATAVALRDRQEEYRRELRTYVWGYGLALVLTLVPFGLVYWSAMAPAALYLAIGPCAIAQAVIHFRCFLHIDPPRQNVDDLHLILFSSLLLFFMVGGTIWILANLATRMH